MGKSTVAFAKGLLNSLVGKHRSGFKENFRAVSIPSASLRASGQQLIPPDFLA
jgi:hypothetical protein